MTAIYASFNANEKLPTIFPLIDTHTHFDAPVFDVDREEQIQKAYQRGVRHLVLVGYLQRHFDRLYATKEFINKQVHAIAGQTFEQKEISLHAHIALGLHPFYIDNHTDEHLENMAQMLNDKRPLAIGEIGFDTFTDEMKQPDMVAKQARFFKAQLDMAVSQQLPVMLHIRKAHAEALALLKAHDYDAHELGGVAHSFSGGEQEAKAFVKLGFKLGVTGQVTNPNAKKLRRAIQAAVDTYGIECLVIETDCPDMTPIMCQVSSGSQSALGQSPDDEWGDAPAHDRNVPANLPYVLGSLSELLAVPTETLAEQFWHNSCNALRTDWRYPVQE
ncbi:MULTISPECIES: TatD family hydrolase [Psychrobacter]|jgi:TatD DNase family protein|uniref:TatD family hydrolase n=1 Tax=Psychrobacter communis TaxID=2762238 RepID=A0ABR8RGV5_9GAMM|nr:MULTISPECIES: TatD family hydrolase [Psychrobacter]MBD7947036.1 TatD family hydrolase [Psychrobacter communis]MCG3860114.1 TatD family hydrolase [Psychrobacter sp. Ps5]WLW65866.1 TatD family hydrolase [Psychrobacter sp. van23A]HCR87705.1 hydrolase [Psychrobacter sp.]